ncbi:MAG: RNA polymerase-binding protein RbpA [Propionibacteriaceae bacterium]|jgi:hypothetical protein|nr:RNA polymerase-binding protein RbpA [Propionibacteriaceae bacterium]
MLDRSLHGRGLGEKSFASPQGVDLAPRQLVGFTCHNGHSFELAFSAEAEPPTEWECPKCGAFAVRADGTRPVNFKVPKAQRTHWDMLRERRSVPELEALLAERLAEIRR